MRLQNTENSETFDRIGLSCHVGSRAFLSLFIYSRFTPLIMKSVAVSWKHVNFEHVLIPQCHGVTGYCETGLRNEERGLGMRQMLTYCNSELLRCPEMEIEPPGWTWTVSRHPRPLDRVITEKPVLPARRLQMWRQLEGKEIKELSNYRKCVLELHSQIPEICGRTLFLIKGLSVPW